MRPFVVNALGVLDNPNLRREPDVAERTLADWQRSWEAVDERSIAEARRAGIAALNLTLGHVAGEADAFEATVRDIAGWDAFVRRHPATLRKVLDADDIARAHDAGQVGLVYGFQNTTMLGDDADRIATFAGLGVRVIQLTYNGRNAVGCGATVADDTGLSAFGREVVDRLQQERVLVDLSHGSERTCRDALARARRPMAVTHTGCRALADHPRNLADDLLRRVADTGGVVGIYAMPYLRAKGQPHAEDLVAHLEHAIAACGEDHVGLGTDGGTTMHDDPVAYRAFLAAEVEMRRRMGIGAPGEDEAVSLFLPDLCGADQFERLAALLSARGHGDARIAKILGGNVMRVMRDAWA